MTFRSALSAQQFKKMFSSKSQNIPLDYVCLFPPQPPEGLCGGNLHGAKPLKV